MVGDDVVKEATTQSFDKDVIEESRRQPVLVVFWAPWAGLVFARSSILEKAIRGAKSKAKLVRVNIDDNPELAERLHIQPKSIPLTVFYINGKASGYSIVGAPLRDVIPFIERVIKKHYLVEKKSPNA